MLAAAAIDAVFATLGKAGQILAGGVATPCTVLVAAPDQFGEFGHTRLFAQSAQLEIRVSEIPAPAEGDTVTVEGISYRIATEPRREDPDRRVWTCDAAVVS
ncbi:MAG: hypothetical protein WCO00_09380 [Rhodospirillaceae bacterium]